MVSSQASPPGRRWATLAGAVVAVLLLGGSAVAALPERGPAPAPAPADLRRLGPLHPFPPAPRVTVDPVTGKRRVGGALGAGPLFAVGSGRALTAWVEPDNTVRVSSADVTTGAARWAPRRVGQFVGLLSVLSVPGADLVGVRGSAGDVRPDGTGVRPPGDYRYTMLVLDPGTGATRWTVDTTGAGLLVSADTLVVSKRSGAVAYDLVTGRERWRTGRLDRTQAETFPYLHLTERGSGSVRRPPTISPDGRFHLLDRTGTLQTRDMRTGTLLSTLRIGRYGQVRLADGTVYWTKQHGYDDTEVWAAPLAAAGRSRRLVTAQPGYHLGFTVCGADLLCVAEGGRGDRSLTRAVRVSDGRVLWTRPDFINLEYDYLGEHAGTVLAERALIGPDGRDAVAADENDLANILTWYDRDTLLMITGITEAVPAPVATFGTVTGVGPAPRVATVVTVTAATGERRLRGDLPVGVDIGDCRPAPDRLVCPIGHHLGIWSLTGR